MYLYLPTPLHFLCFCPGLRHHQLSPEQHQSSTDIYSDFLPCTIYSWCSTQSNLLKIVITPIIPCLKASSGISYFSWSWPVAFGLLTPWNDLIAQMISHQSSLSNHHILEKPSLTTLSEVTCQVLAITTQSLTFCITFNSTWMCLLYWLLSSVWVFHLKLNSLSTVAFSLYTE